MEKEKEKDSVEQQKASPVKNSSNSRRVNVSDVNLSGSNYKTRYYLAAKKRHCSTNSLNQMKDSVDQGSSRGFTKCPSCLKWFGSRNALDTHQKKFNHWTKQKTGCRCPFCRKIFLYVGQRNSHIQCHLHGRQKVEAEKFLSDSTCSHCKKCFHTKKQKLKHVSEEHLPKIPEVYVPVVVEKSHASQPKSKHNVKRPSGSNSNKCGTKAQSAAELPAKKPAGRPQFLKRKAVKCSFCRNTFSGPQGLTRHLQQKHRSMLQFQCSVCRTRFPSYVQALTHAKRQHKGGTVKKLIVGRARKRNKTGSAVKQATSSKLSCDTENCGHPSPPEVEKDLTGNFTNGGSDSHESSPKGNRLACSVCHTKSFSSLSALKRHENSLNHKKNVSMLKKTKNEDAEVDSNIKILCSVCKEEFSTTLTFVLHRMSHFSSECDVSSSEADISFCYGCEICGDEIFGIKKVQFHLLWHEYTVRCARKKAKVTSESRHPCSCGKSGAPAAPAHMLFTCINCKRSFMGKAEFIDHKRKCSNYEDVSGSVGRDGRSCCVKYCIVHDTELCCLNDSNKNSHPSTKGNGRDCTLAYESNCNVALNSDMEVPCPVSSSHKQGTSELVSDNLLPTPTVRRMSHLRNETFTPNFYPALTCSSCRRIARSLKEFKEHSCSPLDVSPAGSMSSDKNYASSTSSGERDSSCESTEMLTRKLRRRSNTMPDGLPRETSDIPEFERRNAAARPDSFRENLSNLLYLLISDEKLMARLGWGERPIDVIVENMLKCFGKQAFTQKNGMSDGEVFRKNVHMLLQLCLKDTVMQELTDFDSIDSMVKNVLIYLTILQPSSEEKA